MLNRFFRNYIKEHWLSLVAIIILATFICRNFFYANYPAGTDVFGWISRVEYFKNIVWYSWDPSSFGVVRQSTLQNVLVLFNNVINNPASTIKVFIFLVIMLAGFSMYNFTYAYLKDKHASCLSGILFMMTPFFIGKMTIGHIDQAFAYALLPLLFFVFDRVLHEGGIKWTLILSILIFIIANFTRLDILFYFGTSLMLFLIITVLFSKNKNKIFRNILKTSVYGSIIILTFSAFQLLPNVTGAVPAYISVGKTFAPVEHLSTWSLDLHKTMLGLTRELGYQAFLGGASWNAHPFLSKKQYFILLSIFPVIAYSTTIFSKNRLTFSFALLAIFTTFLAKGPHMPLGELYLWGFNNVPFFGALRAPTRWLMVMSFAYVFLAGAFVKSIQERFPEKKYFSTILVITLISIAFLTNPFVLTDGFKTWSPPEQEVNPHKWINNQSSEFRVATVPYSQPHMNTGSLTGISVGWWEQDIGADSFFYHNRPVIGTGGWFWGSSPEFVRYTTELIIKNGTKNLMKILGTFDVKYLVLQGYLPTYPDILPKGSDPYYQHAFFKKQKGLKPVYIFGNATVYENEYWTPRIFAAPRSAIVVGGRDALTALAEIDEFSLSNWALFFADQVIRENGKETYFRSLDKSDALIFVNSEPLDLAMLMLDNATRIKAVRYAYPSTNTRGYWVGSDSATRTGMLVLNSRTLSTSGENSVSIPVELEQDGNYEVWTRVVYHKDKGRLSLSIDGKEIGSIVPYSPGPSIKWVKLGEVDFGRGKHALLLKNNKSVYGIKNDVDEVIIVRSGNVEEALNKTIRLLQNYKGEIVYFIGRGEFRLVNFGKIVTIADDDQTKFWRNNNQEYVELSDSLDVPSDSKNSLKINIHTPNRKYSTLIEKKFVRLEDWSKNRGFSLWFKGSNTGAGFDFSVFFDNSYNNWAKFSFIDSSSNWKNVKFDKNMPDSTNGSVDWSKVWLVRVSNTDKKITGAFYIDNLQRFGLEEREANISVLKEEMYEIALMARGKGEVTVNLDGISKTLRIDETSNKWSTVGPYSLKKGRYNIRMNIPGNVKIEQIRVHPVNTILLNTTPTHLKVNFTKINPTKYIVNLETDAPVFLVFSDSYHPMWRAYVNGREYKSIITYSFINSFYIPETGKYDVTIEFIGQRYVWVGMIISIISFTFAVSYLFYDWRVNKGDRWANAIRTRIEHLHEKIFDGFGVFYVYLRKR